MQADKRKTSKISVFKKSHVFLVLAALTLLVLAAFWPCLNNGFINLDDGSYIVENGLIKSITPAQVRSWFSESFEGNYYPLVLLTYALEYKINGPDPMVYHLTSILLHLLNAFLVFGFFLLLLKNGWKAGVIAALWAIHPLRVESVAWAAAQKDLVYTFFSLLSLAAYLRYKNREKIADYAASLSFFLLACFSKGMAVALVPLLFLLDRFLEKRSNRRSWLEKAPFFILAAVFGLVAAKAQQQGMYIQASRALSDNLLVAGYGFLFYIIKTVLPAKLSAFHPYPGSPLPWQFYAGSLASIALVSAVLIRGRRHKMPFRGFLFYAMTIAFVLQIVPVGGFVAAERYSYLSSLGLLLAAAWGLLKLAEHPERFRRTAGRILLALLVTAGATLSARRCLAWRDSITIWSDAIGKYPGENSFAYNQRGAAYAAAGLAQKAADDFTRAVEITPKYFDAYYNRGCVYYKMERYQEAAADCRRAIEIYPGFAKAYNMRSIAYGRLKEYPKALSDIDQAIRLFPFSSEFYYNRGTTLGQMKEYARALDDFNKAIALDPGFGKAYLYRGYTHYMLGDRQRSEQDVQKARSLGAVR